MKETSYTKSFLTDEDDAGWLITYADLMTLLLVFFVLLYTLSSFEKEKYKKSVETIQQKLDTNQEVKGVMEVFDRTADRKISIEDLTGLRSRETAMLNSIKKLSRKKGRDQNFFTQIKNGKIILTISGETLFKSGSAALNASALPNFIRLIQIFDDFPEYTINIKGHTDNIPISTQIFPSNWELSAIRATTVLKFLISKGIKPQRMTATGYGDILPLIPNTTEENRARNRRVEFVLEKKETND
jgi:chemotaxis protein MotB